MEDEHKSYFNLSVRRREQTVDTFDSAEASRRRRGRLKFVDVRLSQRT